MTIKNFTKKVALLFFSSISVVVLCFPIILTYLLDNFWCLCGLGISWLPAFMIVMIGDFVEALIEKYII